MGGAAFTNIPIRRIHRNEIRPTLEYLAQILSIPGLDAEYMASHLMGSAGRQDDSGDLDIALDKSKWPRNTLTQINTIYRSKAGDKFSRNPGIASAQINLAVPIMGDPNNEYAQVDFIWGPLEWLLFSHYSPGKDLSPYKGVFISTLLAVLAKVKKDWEVWIPGTEPSVGTPTKDIDYVNRIARIGWSYDLELGLHRKWQLQLRKGQGASDVSPDYFETHAPRILARYGIELDVPRFPRTGYITNPTDVIKILLGDDVTQEDVNTFEKLWSVVKQKFDPKTVLAIKDRTAEALMLSGARNDFSSAEEIKKLPVFEESLDEAKIIQAAFRDKKSGKIFPSGSLHDFESIPDSWRGDINDLENGFLTDDGRFLDRQEAARLVKLKQDINREIKSPALHSVNVSKLGSRRVAANFRRTETPIDVVSGEFEESIFHSLANTRSARRSHYLGDTLFEVLGQKLSPKWAVGKNMDHATIVGRHDQTDSENMVVWLPINIWPVVDSSQVLGQHGEGHIGNRVEQAIGHWMRGGWMDPPLLGVHNKRIHFTDGRHRIRAAEKLGAKKFPAIIHKSDLPKLMRLVGVDKHE